MINADNWQTPQLQHSPGTAHPSLNILGVKRRHRLQCVVHVMGLPSMRQYLKCKLSIGLLVGDCRNG